jgi:cell division protein ZapE
MSMALDPAQARAWLKFDALKASLSARRGLRAFFKREAPPKGLYIWGDVGRGKTMLMDRFFEAADVKLKRRAHFHAFMQDIHARLHSARKGNGDALAPVAAAIAGEARLLCLDEMQIADIADAMIVGRLFEALFAAGTVIVTTSNLPPTELYHDGLNRQLFLPFIVLMSEKLDVVHLEGTRDYRLGRIAADETYLTPLTAETERHLQALWERLTDEGRGAPADLDVLGRKLLVPEAAHGCARFSFADLCQAPLGPADYLAIAKAFKTVFIARIPKLDPAQKNEAKRFTLLIDALYDARTRLVASAATPPEAISKKTTEFARTASRLREMQSADWWNRN